MIDCLIVCETRPNADRLYKYLLNHLASFNVPLRTERRIRSVEILTTEIRVVSAHEYYMKCQIGFNGKVINEDEAWRMIDEDKKRLTNKKKEKTLMIEKIAYIKSPTGSVFPVKMNKHLIDNNSAIEIHAKDGEVYITHLSNVLIIKSEVKDAEKTDKET